MRKDGVQGGKEGGEERDRCKASRGRGEGYRAKSGH